MLFCPYWRQEEATWPSGKRVGLAIRRFPVRVPLQQLPGFVLGRPEFKSLATIVNCQPVTPAIWGFSSCDVLSELFVSNYLSRVPENELD